MIDELSRRAVLMAAAALAKEAPRTFVLVPGAWHGAWAWRAVEKLLRARGHQVFALTLTGVAERSHLLSPSVTLETHVTDVARVIEVEDLHDAVLVGHSYAGVVIAPAAARVAKRLSRLVFLDAFVPKPGQSMLDLMKAKYSDSWRLAAKGGLTVPPMLNAQAMGVGASEAAAIDAKLTPHPLATLEDKAQFDEHAIAGLPKHYIRCGAYAGFKPWAERATSWGWPVTTIETGHDAMITAPEALVDALLG